MNHQARIAWLLGYPDRAIRQAEASLVLAQQLDHPLSVVMGMQVLSLVHQWRGEPQRVEDWARGAEALAAEHAFPRHQSRAVCDRAWATAQQEGYEDGLLRELRRDKERWESDREAAYYHCRLTGSLERAGRVEEGLLALAEARSFVETTGQRLFDAELHRIEGELLLKKGDIAAAEACFQQALVLARRQGAKAWELRAATSLARLWADQGKRPEGHRLLAEVYGWFSEGFETADLQEAQGLLAQLA
jgi:predicted ATPase